MSNEEKTGGESRVSERRKRERQNFILNVTAIGLMVAVAIVLVAVLITMIKLKSGEASKQEDPEQSASNTTEEDTTTTAEPEETTTVSTVLVGEGHVICLDPGHGGDATGEVVGDRTEKEEDLEIATLIKASLEELGYTVVLTRSDDTNPGYQDRATTAANANAEAMVVIHRTSDSEYGDATIETGASIYVASAGSDEGTALGNSILSALDASGTGITVNSVHTGFISNSGSDYSVVTAAMSNNITTCVLILGNMSSDTDNEGYDTYKTQYAAAVAEGISNYVLSVADSEAETTVAEE
ncbi:MAG: N-acetylmuramoyl-L-alanine amidase [Lachnospiraceae bacterium]|nr:N-acetylmuramoyl-L-alanine amidase [Lachnospiraceae bacterium]